jgi:type II secretory ATPase GspE/PulE/Tfp pilus assembly ATPase PilB-like protein
LVRRLCTHCRQPHDLDEAGLRSLAHLWVESSGGRGDTADALLQRWRQRHADAQGRVRVFRRQGCAQCEGTGYQGRLGLHELMLTDEAVRELVRRRAPAGELQAAALSAGMTTLRQDGIDKVLAGQTDLPEVIAATNA